MEKTIEKIDQKALKHSRHDFFRLGVSILFMLIILLYTFLQNGGIPDVTFLAIASVVGAYMAMNIGANDVANNVGPAVGSKALTLTGAIVIAVIFEASGALIAGGDVVSTIKKGIIDPNMFENSKVFIWAMLAALFGGAIWLNLATIMSAPVSTTHSIVGGVMGAGIASSGFDIVNWSKMGTIASSWVISPVLGGLVAALFLYIIKRTVFHKEDMVESAKKVLPILISVMVFAFATYLSIKGIKKIVKIDFMMALFIGFAMAGSTYLIIKPMIIRAADKIKNTREGINSLFTIPLIFAAALLSFAHGANDVANAIGPLAAINDAITSGEITQKAQIPLWVMMVGAIGIGVGLAMYGPKLIKTVGSEITELDQARAWSIAIASAIVVIIASWLGLPVSSTHIAIGGIFGVGFLRIYVDTKYGTHMDNLIKIRVSKIEKNITDLECKLGNCNDDDEKASIYRELEDKKEEIIKSKAGIINFSKQEKKDLKKMKKEKYVKKEMLIKIITAWLVTVPASALLSAILFFTIKGIMV